MHALVLVLAMLAAPFWEKAPEAWSAEELQQMFVASPWGREAGTVIYLASAKPMREAEEQVRLRSGPAGDRAPEEPDYRDFLRDSGGKYIVVAARLPDGNALADAGEERRMEKDSYLKVGKTKYKMVGHFPPTPADPMLRIVFPRPAGVESVKSFSVQVYLPSVALPYRLVEFELKEMGYQGRLEM